MTIDLLDVDLRGVFEVGMTYVALSRGVSIDRMRVSGFSLSGVKTNAKWCARVLDDVKSCGVLHGNRSKEEVYTVSSREVYGRDQEWECASSEGRSEEGECTTHAKGAKSTPQEDSTHHPFCEVYQRSTQYTLCARVSSKQFLSEFGKGSPTVQQVHFTCFMQQRENTYNYRLFSLSDKSLFVCALAGVGSFCNGSISCPVALTPIS